MSNVANSGKRHRNGIVTCVCVCVCVYARKYVSVLMCVRVRVHARVGASWGILRSNAQHIEAYVCSWGQGGLLLVHISLVWFSYRHMMEEADGFCE